MRLHMHGKFTCGIMHTLVGNSIYANGTACAESVLESCHLLDMALLQQNRHIEKQID